MSHEILFKQVQLEALQLPSQEMPYTLGQAVEVREYATRRRNALLDAGTSVRNIDIEADFVQTAISSIEDQLLSDMTSCEAAILASELQQRSHGFTNAGCEQTGLQPPRSYRRIGAVAAGFVRHIEKNQSHMLAG